MKSSCQAISLSKDGQRSISRALDRITALRREWNALSAAQRAAIAKESCDRANFFRSGLPRGANGLLSSGGCRAPDLMQPAIVKRVLRSLATTVHPNLFPLALTDGAKLRDPAA